MQKNKAKLTLFAILTFVCTLIIGGLAFAVPNLFASAAILPDRFDPDRFTAIQFPELKEPDAQKYYGNGYWVVQDYATASTGGAKLTTELDGFKIDFTTTGTQNFTFTLAKNGVLQFTYCKSGSATISYTLDGTDTALLNTTGSVEHILSKGTHTVVFSATKTTASEQAIITRLEFGEGPQGGIYKDSGLEWAAEKGNKLVEENLDMIRTSYQNAGFYGSYWNGDDSDYKRKVFPMVVSGSPGAYTINSAQMIDEDNYGYTEDGYEESPISIIEIPFTLSSTQTISFNYSYNLEENYDGFLAFLDDECIITGTGSDSGSFSRSMSAGKHNIMFVVAKDYSGDYDDELVVTNLNITSAVDISTLSASANQSYSYKGKISAITNYDIYDVFASCYHTEGDPAQNVYDTTGINYGGEAGTYSDVGTVFDNTNGYYFKTIHEAANYFNSIQTASTTFNMVILDDIEVENEATFNNANVATFNIYTDDNDTLRTETNPYILENTNGGSILDLESSTVTINAVVPLKLINSGNYAIKFNESGNASSILKTIIGTIILESNHSNILLNNVRANITGAKIVSTNTKSSFANEYFIESKGNSANITFYQATSTFIMDKIAFAKVEGYAAIYFMHHSNLTYTSSGVDHDVLIAAERTGGAFISDTQSLIENAETDELIRLKVKYTEESFSRHVNNYSQQAGIAWVYSRCSSLMDLVEYYEQTEEIGGYSFRERLETLEDGNQRRYIYLLENIGVVFNQNIPEATILGETIRERNSEEKLDISPITTISVPYGFEIKSDAEYIQSNEELDKPSEENGVVYYVPSYDVYGYKKLGWSNNDNEDLNSFARYDYDGTKLLESLDSDVQITHAFVGGSVDGSGNDIDNYGYNSSNNVVENGVTKRYIYYYSRWYQFLGDSILYSDTSTADASEGTSVIPIYFADELVYLSTILSLEKVTAYKGSEIQTFNNSSYAVMEDLSISSYTGYGEDGKTGDGKWTYSASSTVKSYYPMCLTEDMAFTGQYFVGAMRISDDTNGTYATNVQTSEGEKATRIINFNSVRNLENTDSSLAGYAALFGRASNTIIENIQIENININSACINTGGLVGYGDNIAINNCVNKANLTAPQSVGGIAGKIERGGVAQCINIGDINSTATDFAYAGGIVGWASYITISTSQNGYMENSEVESGFVSGCREVAGIVGHLVYESELIECINFMSNVTCTTESGGGIVGYVYDASMSNCQNDGGRISGAINIGGIAGKADSATQFSSCYNTGTISCSNRCAGGIVGYATSHSIKYCVNEGYIENTKTTIDGNGHIGGIVGFISASGANIENCANKASINAPNGHYVAGIAGAANIGTGTITSCFNGLVDTLDSSDVKNYADYIFEQSKDKSIFYIKGNRNSGGIVGYSEGGINISDCFNFISICGSSTNIGGIIGRLSSGSLTVNTNYGYVSAGTNGSVGGIAGYASHTPITNCYTYNPQICGGGDYVGGIVGLLDGDKSYIQNCNTEGKAGGDYWITGSGDNNNSVTASFVAGIAGHCTAAVQSISYCNLNGYIRIWGTTRVGGIGGQINTNVTACNNNTTYNPEDSAQDSWIIGTRLVGGIIGYLDNATIYNSHRTNVGSSTATNCIRGGFRVGGIVGSSINGIVNSCNNYDNVITTNTNEGDSGGIVGYIQHTGANPSWPQSVISCINYGQVSGTMNVGGIAGTIQNAWVYNCVNDASASVSTSSSSHVGGIAGYSTNGAITESTNNGTISLTTGWSYVGGILGYGLNSSYIAICTNNSPIGVNGTGSSVGGIVGEFINSTVENSINNNKIAGYSAVGGIAGYVEHSGQGSETVKNSTNNGTVVGTQAVGGVVGMAKNCAITANTSNSVDGSYIGGSSWAIGGIVGYAVENIMVQNGTNSSNISADNAISIGGIVGCGNNSTITNSNNSADVTGESYVGGIVGEGTSVIIRNCNNYSSATVSGDTNVGGIIGKSVTSHLFECTNYGDVYGFISDSATTSYSSIGGVAGYVSGKLAAATYAIQQCYITDVVIVSGNSDVGGIVGYLYSSSSSSKVGIADCANQGARVGAYYQTAGGVVGRATNANLINCYIRDSSVSVYYHMSGSGDNVVVVGAENAGGIVGRAQTSISINNCDVISSVIYAVVSVGSIYGSASGCRIETLTGCDQNTTSVVDYNVNGAVAASLNGNTNTNSFAGEGIYVKEDTILRGNWYPPSRTLVLFDKYRASNIVGSSILECNRPTGVSSGIYEIIKYEGVSGSKYYFMYGTLYCNTAGPTLPPYIEFS